MVTRVHEREQDLHGCWEPLHRVSHFLSQRDCANSCFFIFHKCNRNSSLRILAVLSAKNSAGSLSLGLLVDYTPGCSHLMGLVSRTLLYQTRYSAFYSSSKWPRYGHRRVSDNMLNVKSTEWRIGINLIGKETVVCTKVLAFVEPLIISYISKFQLSASEFRSTLTLNTL